jgi:aryl-alcohol dehydrogenase-like predicted oxidoreductase
MRITSGLGGTGVLAMPWWMRVSYVKTARLLRIQYFDTAQYYGPSEEIMGKSRLERFTIITKWGMGPAPSDVARWTNIYSPEACSGAIQTSKKRLGRVESVGFLLHLPVDGLVQEHIKVLKAAKEQESLRFIGYSADTRRHVLSDNSWCDWIVIHHSLAAEFSEFTGVIAIHGVFKDRLTPSQLEDVAAHLPRASQIVFLIGTSKPWRLITSWYLIRKLSVK